jgi:phycocyanobilin lyase subunit beta
MATLPQLREAIEVADSALKMTDAVRALADAQLLESVPDLMAALSYNNPGAAVAAVDGLIAIGLPAVPNLLSLIDSHNYTARAWAVRALAGIGDPSGLEILLDAARNDFAMSVRRAAVRGLGFLRWSMFEDAQQARLAQQRCCEALIPMLQDEEWVVRYSAVTGLEALAIALSSSTAPKEVSQQLAGIQLALQGASGEERDLGVRSRLQLALNRIALPVGSASG